MPNELGAVFAPIRPGVLATEVSARIRERILDGSLSPGESIKDSVLAETLGLSRSPVREALRILEVRGLVRKTPNRSYEVISFTPADIAELATLRIAYETIAVRWLTEHEVALDELVHHLEAMELGVDSSAERARVIDADAHFHMSLIALTGMPRLVSSYGAIRDQLFLALSSGFLSHQEFIVTQRERHQTLFDLLVDARRNGDPSGVIAEIDHHIKGGLGLLPEQIGARRA